MKKSLSILTLIALCSTSNLFAGGGKNGFNSAAEKYDRQAKEAKAKGNHEAARILSQMADIKRAAAAGRVKSWDEYHKLSRELKDAMGWNKGKDHAKHEEKKKKGFGKYTDKSKETWGKKKKGNKTQKKGINDQQLSIKKDTHKDKMSADQSAKASSKYESQAKMHMQQADEALKNQENDSANIHNRLAQLLVNASIEAQRGKQPDLTEYFNTQRQLFDVKNTNNSAKKDDVDNW